MQTSSTGRTWSWGLALLLGASLLFSKGQASVAVDQATLVLEVRDEQGKPLVARARVAPLDWTDRARLGQWTDLRRTLPERGAALSLKPGRYRVFVSRGPEWSLAELRVELAAGDRLRQRVSLVHQVALPGWQGADLHVHTQHSDDAVSHGGVSALDLRAEGISLAIATDHNHVGDLGSDIDSVAGAEITTWAPEIGHFNAFPLRSLPRWRGTTPRALFEEVSRDPEVFLQVNHPRLEDHIAFFTLGEFDGRRFARQEFSLDAHGLEVWNGYQIGALSSVQRVLGEFRAWVAAGHRLTATGGSDSHGRPGHLAGYPRTYVRAARAAELAGGLKRGAAFVTNGPLLALRVNDGEPGARVQPARDRSVRVELEVLAPDWLRVEHVELWADEKCVWSRRIPAPEAGPLRFRASARIDVARARTLHAVARGGSGLDRLLGRRDVEPLAFTNPVYLARTAGKPAPH